VTREAILKRLGLLPQIVTCFRHAVCHSRGRPLSVARLMLQTLARGYWPLEAYRLGLLHPDRGPALLEVHQSKRAMVRIQRKINPASDEHRLSDKAQFYKYCQAAGLPVPPLAAVFDQGGEGWTASPPVPGNDREWGKFFEAVAPSAFVIKPSHGRHGRGVLFLTRSPGGLTTPDGTFLSGEFLVGIMRGNAEYRSYVIQERVGNHPALAALMPGCGLATSRIITLHRDETGPEIVSADLKILLGKNLTSNFGMGESGNLAATVSVRTGRIETVVGGVEGLGCVEVDVHPETGFPFREFVIPDWAPACALVLRAAKSFLPIRAIGWDVAFTPSGPLLLEGNFYFDPPNSTFRGMKVWKLLNESVRGSA
jgi:hypothetical protein